MDIELPLDFKEFLKLLNDKGVRYLLIGGYAVGHPRATNDMDIWIAIHPDNAQRVVNARVFLFYESLAILQLGKHISAIVQQKLVLTRSRGLD